MNTKPADDNRPKRVRRSKPKAKGSRTLGRRARIALRMGVRNLERLQAEIDVTESMADHLFRSQDRDIAEKLLAKAAQAREESDLEAGWKALNAAMALRFGSMEEPERRAAADVIRAEVNKKASDSWRAAAVEATLKPSAEDPTAAPSARALSEAQLILSEHSANVYRRLDMFAVILAWTTVTLTAAIGLFVIGVESNWFPNLDRPLDDAKSTAGVLTLGALGALISTATNAISGRGTRRLPEMSSGLTVALIRPVLGAASAVVVVLVLISGLQATVSADGARVWVFAVAAGFSERLLDRMLATVEKSVSS